MATTSNKVAYVMPIRITLARDAAQGRGEILDYVLKKC